ncbi:DUF3465 domain-containing protein [Acinetobacter shaoyimingii]|uniref:DUF3465 domain-containing protein n=1 Tax=Acinetobacter shaoyimingii TaxID=2715164 RepID=A0A6G8RWY9_9GAMM|nr:DUF3465 domain-containing protein [Acinetobacter shaoyimingii]QIO06407.1 DUF3465 domain-containing protein [Acinetobacter shaoyimingii]
MSNKTNLSIAGIVGLLVAGYFGFNSENIQQTKPVEYSSQQQDEHIEQSKTTHLNSQSQASRSEKGLARIQQAYEAKQKDVQVQASGKVKAILRDDNEGSRHQKFILTLDNGMTVLVAHNIDLSPRIDDLQKGDLVEFNGEYEFNDQGGVVHWTHRDPQNRHEHGWLKHNGKIYE